MTDDRSFPPGFLWGTATAAHQIEGNNLNNDWWAWEHTEGSGCAEPSGDACDSWYRWADDVAVIADMGLGVYRFSLEWSRIEPADGEFSPASIANYRRLCEALRARGIMPMVTYHHFTTPKWLADRGGWENADIVDAFGRYCRMVTEALGDVIGAVCTINEPAMVAAGGYLSGMFPPGRVDVAARRVVTANLVAAHRRAVEVVREVAPGVPVGWTLSMADYHALEGGQAKLERIRRGMEDVFLEAVEGDDFVGVQAYSRDRIGPDGQVFEGEPGVPMLVMGYEYWPRAIEAALRRAAEVTGGRVPLWVTENGIGTDDDTQRIDYVHAALEGVLRVIADGIDVRGYTYWSLLDNFEWALGYRPRFGLVDVDRTTFVRTPKPSAAWFGAVARANRLVDAPTRADESAAASLG
ncbi:MAG: family 1 glycosylhydrolase [Actinobacteria bacterium]|nr:family 1 glycosylhydrolase [Actinomycetota bacterium]